MEGLELMRELTKANPKYLHKNKNVYIYAGPCRIQIDDVWIDGVIYFNDDITKEDVYVRTKENFEQLFQRLD